MYIYNFISRTFIKSCIIHACILTGDQQEFNIAAIHGGGVTSLGPPCKLLRGPIRLLDFYFYGLHLQAVFTFPALFG